MVMEQTYSDLRKLMELLLPEQKEVIYLRHFANLSFKEIAEETNVSINTALARMRYALVNLRKLSKEKEIDLCV
jgi:RNA polymerase sigma factor (sigma-70 family)